MMKTWVVSYTAVKKNGVIKKGQQAFFVDNDVKARQSMMEFMLMTEPTTPYKIDRIEEFKIESGEVKPVKP